MKLGTGSGATSPDPAINDPIDNQEALRVLADVMFRSAVWRDALLDDLDAAARRLEHLTGDDRWHHPSTRRAVRIAVDDIADTIARMREG